MVENDNKVDLTLFARVTLFARDKTII